VANDVTVADARPRLLSGVDVFSDPESFKHAEQVARVFAASTMVPAHLRGNLADCLIAYQIARRLNEEPLTVMQNIYIIGGRPGWLTQYVVGRANRSGIFKGRILWKSSGAGETLAVTASAVLADSGEAIDVTCDMKMAQAEGWTKNAKYKSMPEHMLRWRSAAMLIRLYAPEVMLGIPTMEEAETLPPVARDVTPARQAPARTVDGVLNAFAQPAKQEAPLQPAQEPDHAPDHAPGLPPHDADGVVIEDNEAQEAAASIAQRAMEAAFDALREADQPADAGEYEGFILARWEAASTEAERNAIRNYWKFTATERKRFGMSENQVRSLADRMRHVQPVA
jgi:hypothetical protein